MAYLHDEHNLGKHTGTVTLFQLVGKYRTAVGGLNFWNTLLMQHYLQFVR